MFKPQVGKGGFDPSIGDRMRRAPGFRSFAYNGTGTLVTIQGNTVCTVTNYYPGQPGYTVLPYVNLQGDSVNYIGDVIYSNGLFVIHGRDKILTSPDGISWTYREPPPRYNGTRAIRYTAVEYIGGGVWAICVVASANSIGDYRYANGSVQIWHTSNFSTYTYKSAVANIPSGDITYGFIFKLYNNRLMLVLTLSVANTSDTESLLYTSDSNNFNSVFYRTGYSYFSIAFSYRVLTHGNTIILGGYISTDGGNTFSIHQQAQIESNVIINHSNYGYLLFYNNIGGIGRENLTTNTVLPSTIINEYVDFRGNDRVLQHNGYLRIGSWESY